MPARPAATRLPTDASPPPDACPSYQHRPRAAHSPPSGVLSSRWACFADWTGALLIGACLSGSGRHAPINEARSNRQPYVSTQDPLPTRAAGRHATVVDARRHRDGGAPDVTQVGSHHPGTPPAGTPQSSKARHSRRNTPPSGRCERPEPPPQHPAAQPPSHAAIMARLRKGHIDGPQCRCAISPGVGPSARSRWALA